MVRHITSRCPVAVVVVDGNIVRCGDVTSKALAGMTLRVARRPLLSTGIDRIRVLRRRLIVTLAALS